MRKRNKKKEYLWVETQITEIEEKNKPFKETYKNVFYCKSKTGSPRLCVAWGEHRIEVGDLVEMKGRIAGDVFLCWKLYIKNRNLSNAEGI